MKKIKNIAYTLVSLSLITFFAATSFAGMSSPHYKHHHMKDNSKVCLTSGVPAEINSRYLNGK